VSRELVTASAASVPATGNAASLPVLVARARKAAHASPAIAEEFQEFLLSSAFNGFTPRAQILRTSLRLNPIS
jgi:hypothetical protein